MSIRGSRREVATFGVLAALLASVTMTGEKARCVLTEGLMDDDTNPEEADVSAAALSQAVEAFAVTPEEQKAAVPTPVDWDRFNPNVALPYDLTTDAIGKAMEGFVRFLGFINDQMLTQGLPRLESMLMPANFSSVVGEFMITNIPNFAPTLAKNTFHNGHPDLVPVGVFEHNSIQHDTRGIEVKGSRYKRGWQGHNAEECWLMVFVFESNRPADLTPAPTPKPGKKPSQRNPAMPFRFLGVVGAQLEQDDWKFSGRSETSRRTITAGVTKVGRAKMVANWIYKIPGSGL